MREVSAPSSSGDTTVVSSVSMAWVSSATADGPAPTTTKTGSRPCSRTSTEVPSSSLVISAAAWDNASIRASRAEESSAKPIRSAACSVSGPIALAAWARSRRSASTYSVMSMRII